MTAFKLRGRQPEWKAKVEQDLERYSRLLFVAPGGIGKSSLMGALAKTAWEEKGVRTLITENREHLTEQTAKRIRDETGLDCDVEMAGQYASPYAPVVVASVQSLSKISRLTSFASDHFGYVIPDECHFCLADSPQRILNYFHYGSECLQDGWTKPKDSTYAPKARVIGFTASPDIGERKSLGEFFQATTVNYSYLDAIEEGWLVGIREENLPIKIDTRKFRRRQTSEGADFNVSDQNAAIEPVINELADQIVRFARHKKTIAFMPSVPTSRMMAAALNARGMTAIFASGECIDKSEKTDAYNAAGPGTVLVNCALVAYGIDFVDTSCIAIYSAVISIANYIQKIYRATRVLSGLVNDSMTAAERRAAIAASPKPFATVISPFFVSDRIDICRPFDLFSTMREKGKRGSAPRDMTDAAKIRDYIKALENAADKHAHKQPRTIDPVKFSLSVEGSSLANYTPENDADAKPASQAEKDFLLQQGIDTSAVKSSGQAQKLIGRLRERDRLGLATPKQLQQLMFRFHWPEEQAVLFKKGRAGITIAKHIEYRAYNKPAPVIEAWSD